MKNIKKVLLSISIVTALFSFGSVSANEEMDHSGHDMANMDHMNHMEASTVGKSGKGMTVTKTYQVSLLDTMRFEFDTTPDLREGDVVKFVITNKGKIAHEFSIGSPTEQIAHREMMKSMPGMVHESDNTVTVKPGATVPLFWQFTGKQPVAFACNVPGHFEAGMKHDTTIR